MIRPHPIELARLQLARDRKATKRFPGLLARKIERMSASPLAYLRGTAPLYYEILADHPELSDGPRGKGWLCGDAHLENFGVYRTTGKGRGRGDEPVVFDVNDFDEAFVGPWRYDVLRLVTSLILGGRELGVSGKRGLELAELLLDAHSKALFEKRTQFPMPAPVTRLLKKVEQRTQRDLVEDRTQVTNGRRRFVLGERYAKLDKKLADAASAAFGNYVRRLETSHAKECFDVVDVAFRIAGTGSLGSLRVAVLTRGAGGPHDGWLFDMKEESAPSASVLVAPPGLSPEKRVIAAMSACVAKPPRLVGSAKIGASRLLVRRLAPQDDKLNLLRIQKEELVSLASYLGALLGDAHRRGAAKFPSSEWTRRDRAELLERAIVVAGLHEASYLAMCRLCR